MKRPDLSTIALVISGLCALFILSVELIVK